MKNKFEFLSTERGREREAGKQRDIQTRKRQKMGEKSNEGRMHSKKKNKKIKIENVGEKPRAPLSSSPFFSYLKDRRKD